MAAWGITFERCITRKNHRGLDPFSANSVPNSAFLRAGLAFIWENIIVTCYRSSVTFARKNIAINLNWTAILLHMASAYFAKRCVDPTLDLRCIWCPIQWSDQFSAANAQKNFIQKDICGVTSRVRMTQIAARTWNAVCARSGSSPDQSSTTIWSPILRRDLINV